MKTLLEQEKFLSAENYGLVQESNLGPDLHSTEAGRNHGRY